MRPSEAPLGQLLWLERLARRPSPPADFSSWPLQIRWMRAAAAQTVQRRTVSAQFRSSQQSARWNGSSPPANQTRAVPGRAMSLFAARTRCLPFGKGVRSTRPMAHPCFNNPHLPLPFPRGPLLTFNRQRPQRRSLSALRFPFSHSLPPILWRIHSFSRTLQTTSQTNLHF